MSAPSLYSVQGIQLKAQKTLKTLDLELSKFDYANEFERKTGVPKTYLAIGFGAFTFTLIFFNIAGQLITNLVAWVYPAYASFKAIESSDKADDKQWLTYWTVVGFFQTIEYFSDILIYWLPFYYLFKTLAILYLALPQLRGAETFYVRILRPYLLSSESAIDSKINSVKSKINQVTNDLSKSN